MKRYVVVTENILPIVLLGASFFVMKPGSNAGANVNIFTYYLDVLKVNYNILMENKKKMN
jgi:hypothetical protein